MVKTYSPKLAEIKHDWYLVDASGQTLGRLASQLAIILQGKHKPEFSNHLDGGDVVVVINAAKIKVTGKKLTDKKYYHHSGYPGGIKETTLEQRLAKDPGWVISHATGGMLPKNRLQDGRLARLKVYAGPDHPHEGQQPKELKLRSK
jgi:large subunit ribosomal protein L13